MRKSLFALLLTVLSIGEAHASQQPTAYGWGFNQYGQVGTGAASTNQPTPAPLILSNLRDIRPGSHHSLGLLSDGTVLGWGRNQYGQASTVPGGNVVLPAAIPGIGIGVAVRAGGSHSLALDDQGEVYTWGLNADGELGTGDNVNHPTPSLVLTNVISISARGRNSMALDASGVVHVWGRNDQGQLGNGTTVSSNVPIVVSIGATIVEIAAGTSHALALDSAGRVWAWGDNSQGQLGVGTRIDSLVPVLVPIDLPQNSSIRTIRAGAEHSAAIDSNGTIHLWGNGTEGQLGFGTVGDELSPRMLDLDDAVFDIDLGASHSIALTKRGRVFVWGSNSQNQLGTGGGDSSSPVELIFSDTSVNYVRAGGRLTVLETGGLLRHIAKHPAYPRELNTTLGPIWRRAIVPDRAEYWSDDASGQFVATFIERVSGTNSIIPVTNDAMRIELRDGTGQVLQTKFLEPPLQHKAQILVGTLELAPGTYRLCAALSSQSTDPCINFIDFVRSGEQWPAVAFPTQGVALQLQPSPLPSSTWPITMGVPLAKGSVLDGDRFALFENGVEIPAQVETVATWHPRFGGSPASIKWLRVSFIASYDGSGNPLSYVLKRLAPSAVPTHPVSVSENGSLLTVDTGRILFEVDGASFRGINRAWFDADEDGIYQTSELVLDNAGRVYVAQPGSGAPYEAHFDDGVVLKVEESGPIRTVISAKGVFYRSGQSEARQRFETRIHAYAGKAYLRIDHRIIVTDNTADPAVLGIADAGLQFKVVGATGFTVGHDGTSTSGALSSTDAFLHQYTSSSARLVDGGETPIGRSDGWFSFATSSGIGVTMLARDFWQRFPKEVSMNQNGFTLHFWPRDEGIEPWTTSEYLARNEIYKLRWAHQGDVLRLTPPQQLIDELNVLNSSGPDANWDVGGDNQIGAAAGANGMGLGFGGELFLQFHPGPLVNAPVYAERAQVDPHGIPDPSWTSASRVMGRVAARNDALYQKAEQELDRFYPEYLSNVVDRTDEYGMFSYGNLHNHWDPATRAAELNRVWQHSHYNNVYYPWLLYLRGTSPNLLTWARAATDSLQDTGFIKHSDVSQVPGRALGAFYHAKGFVPWGSDGTGTHSSKVAHYIGPDAFWVRYLVEGNYRARDGVKTWADALREGSVAGSPFPSGGLSRDILPCLAGLIEWYQLTWDPDVLAWMTDQRNGSLNNPTWTLGSDLPIWHREWFSRAFDFAHDDRALTQLVSWLNAERPGRRSPLALAFAYLESASDPNRERYLDWIRPRLYDELLAIYRHPTNPTDLNGFQDSYNASGMNMIYYELPFFLYALERSSNPAWVPGDSDDAYPSMASRYDDSPPSELTSPPAVDAFVFENGASSYLLRIESVLGNDQFAFHIHRDVWPGRWELLHEGSKTSSPNLTISVPTNDDSAIERIVVNTNRSRLIAPLTDLPEAIKLVRDSRYHAFKRTRYYLVPGRDDGPFRLTFDAGTASEGHLNPGYVRVTDAAGTELLEATVLTGSLQPTVAVPIDPSSSSPPYLVHTYGAPIGPHLTWSEIGAPDNPPYPVSLLAAIDPTHLITLRDLIYPPPTPLLATTGGDETEQVGDGVLLTPRSLFRALDFGGTIDVAASGSRHGALISSGVIYGWGDDSEDAVAALTPRVREPILAVGSDPTCAFVNADFVAIDSFRHNLALRSDGTVWAWGRNANGELGYASPLQNPCPQQVAGLPLIDAVEAGATSSYALASDGTVWAWGSNSSGQLGINSTVTSQSTPAPVLTSGGAVLDNVVRIVAGHAHVLAIRRPPVGDDELYAWGANNNFQIGLGSGPNRIAAVPVTTAPGITDVAAGLDHSAMITGSGASAALYVWGRTTSGALGLGAITSAPTPVTQSPSNFIRVWARRDQTFALTPSGALFAWGNNDEGQLGLGPSPMMQTTPTPVPLHGNIGPIRDVGVGTDWAMILHQ